jgi:glutamate dehydrogenase/leucine dehydrogenase
VIGDEEAPMEDEVDSPEVLANELLSIAQRISDMLGQDASVTSLPPEEDPMMEEKDDNWIQDAEKDIERRGTEGVCTGKNFGSEKCPPGSKRYNLAKTFRKMAKDRKKK